VNTLQARVIITGLEVELNGGGMQLTREPAMRALGRLVGIDAYATFGKGAKGRKKAKEWLEQAIAEAEAE
jgi:hypothetical protein